MPIKKVIAAISGGVDSAVSALLLKRLGYNVEGIFMKNWDIVDETGICSADKDAEDAEWLCKKLDIKFNYVNFTKEYWNFVFSEMLEDYKNGFTPNPDILCNKFIKFDILLNYVINKLGGDILATGHYASTNGFRLYQAKDLVKDQTFFLSQINSKSLKQVMFPIGNITKDQVKQIAIENNFERIARKKESMGICFIGKKNFQKFISEYIGPMKGGNFINIEDGKIVGNHDGIHHWTIGQRCRLSGFKSSFFVLKKDPINQILYVSPGTEHTSLYSNMIICENIQWINNSMENIKVMNECSFRFQNTHALTKCKFIQISNKLIVYLDNYLRALTPGQFAVFYKDGECLGSARIIKIGPSLYDLGLNLDQVSYYNDNMINSKNLYKSSCAE